MAGSVTFTYDQDPDRIKSMVMAWTSDASGNVSGIASRHVTGKVVQVVTDPGAAAPTDNYDITLLDSRGFDVLAGTGANRDTITTEGAVPVQETTVGANLYGNPVYVDGPLTLTIANAGSAKQGTVTVLFE